MFIKNLSLNKQGVFLLRMGLGLMWISHALLKWNLFTIPGFGQWLGTQGISPTLAWPVFLMELFGGIFILVGFYSRLISLALVPLLLVATWVHFPNGWVHTSAGGGWEYPAFLALCSVCLALLDGDNQCNEGSTLSKSLN